MKSKLIFKQKWIVIYMKIILYYFRIPVNVYVEETSINMDNSNVAEIQVPALTVIEHSLPNLKKLNLVKNFPSFKVPINGDASFLGKITDAVNTFRVEYQALYENKPYETQFIYNLGCRPHTENNDRRSDRLFTPYIRDVVPAEFIEKTHKNEFVKHYQMVDGNLTFNIYSFSNLQSDEPYKVPRAEDLQWFPSSLSLLWSIHKILFVVSKTNITNLYPFNL